MKDRTNKEKPLLGQTIECIGMMSRSLQHLQEDEYQRNPMMFALMAGGPIAQIRDLLDDLEWLMEDMVPQHLREQDMPTENVQQPEQFVLPKAA